MEHVHSDGSDQLKANVREIDLELSHCYHGPEDRIFLFGLSRGAFTVRVLAGLLFRCGLATWESTHGVAFFDEAWQLYQTHFTDYEAVRNFCETYNQRDAHVAFLGLWDTVQSYGGLIQIALPHVRHNPRAGIVRHALALDEGRSWFKVTPWGRPDINPDDPDTHIKMSWRFGFVAPTPMSAGSGMQQALGSVALCWMLGEAAVAGLRLNEAGQSMLSHPPKIAMVDSSAWARACLDLRWLAEFIRRWELDYSTSPHSRKLVWGNTGRRHQDSRGGKVLIHESVRDWPTKKRRNRSESPRLTLRLSMLRPNGGHAATT